jgi:molybdate transport system substrate-binding protein
MADLTRYHVAASRSSLVLWMLEEIGKPYDVHLLDMKKGENREPAYLAVTRSLLLAAALAGAFTAAGAPNAFADEIKVLTAGAFKQVVLAVIPQFEKQTGHTVAVDNDTVGALVKRVDRGEAFDVLIASPSAIDELAKNGKIAMPGRTQLAKVGVGVVVREGAPRPDISTVEAFRRTLIEAKSVAYIDPAAGGSSGVYVAKLIEQLGIADLVKSKAKLVPGGAVAEHVVNGEAEIGIHQISEILPVKGAVLVGPLPADIQNFTVYAAGIGTSARNGEVGREFIRRLTDPDAAAVLEAKGMKGPPSPIWPGEIRGQR